MRLSRKNIYLDIDGVILTRGVVPAMHLDKFLKHVLTHYSLFWLTPKYDGNTKKIIEYLSQFISPDTISLLEQIKPTNFDLDKTEAIDFSRNFFWLDDELFDSEKNMLKAHGQYDSWIKVDLTQNPNQLLSLMNTKLALGNLHFSP